MAGREQHLQAEAAEGQPVATGDIAVRRLQVGGGVRQVHGGGSSGRELDLFLGADVARVGMREADPFDRQARELSQDLGGVVAGVDDHRLPGVRAGHQVAVGVLLPDVHLLNREPGHLPIDYS